jgi:hypothetical protein
MHGERACAQLFRRLVGDHFEAGLCTVGGVRGRDDRRGWLSGNGLVAG